MHLDGVSNNAQFGSRLLIEPATHDKEGISLSRSVSVA